MSRPRQDQDQSQKSRNLVLCITNTTPKILTFFTKNGSQKTVLYGMGGYLTLGMYTVCLPQNFILSIRIQKEFQGQINRNLQISILKSECLARLNKRTWRTHQNGVAGTSRYYLIYNFS